MAAIGGNDRSSSNPWACLTWREPTWLSASFVRYADYTDPPLYVSVYEYIDGTHFVSAYDIPGRMLVNQRGLDLLEAATVYNHLINTYPER